MVRLLCTILHLGACEIPGGIGFEVWTQVMHYQWAVPETCLRVCRR